MTRVLAGWSESFYCTIRRRLSLTSTASGNETRDPHAPHLNEAQDPSTSLRVEQWGQVISRNGICKRQATHPMPKMRIIPERISIAEPILLSSASETATPPRNIAAPAPNILEEHLSSSLTVESSNFAGNIIHSLKQTTGKPQASPSPFAVSSTITPYPRSTTHSLFP